LTPEGKVSTADEVDGWEKWELTKSFSKNDEVVYYLRSSAHDKNISCNENGEIYALNEKMQDNSTWKIEFLTGELCFISVPAFAKCLTCDPKGNLGMSDNWQGWEVFRFIELGDGNVLISSWTSNAKKVLCSDEYGTLSTTENFLGDWEKWSIQKSPIGSNGVVIKSVSHGRYL
jgi:hypothetical protein